MWRLTLAQMRRTLPRLVAVGIAVALGTGFITATFLGTATLSETVYQTSRAGIGQADVVVYAGSEEFTDSHLAALAADDAIAAVHPLDLTAREATTDAGSEYLAFSAPVTDERLATTTLVAGLAPAAAGEIAIPEGTARRLAVEIGDELTLLGWDAQAQEQIASTARVVGLTADGSGLGFSTPMALATSADIATWREAEDQAGWYSLTLALADGGSLDQASSAVVGLDSAAHVIDGDTYARDLAEEFTNGLSVLTGLVLAFAAVAMAVAGIVIANTFQVLVAQRTHTLALLRCVGATRVQIRSSVRREALLLGLFGSLGGILGGIGLGQLVLTLLARANQGVPLPSVVPVSVWAIVVPLLVGLGVTMVAASGAARAATRVAPLAALRPTTADDGAARLAGKRVRVVLGWLGVGVGGAMLAGAMALAIARPEDAFGLALGVGVLGGMVSMVGAVMAAPSYVPGLARLLGHALAWLGRTPARLAATNASRNPARTASTATALIVGVTLVTLMSTGAATARTTMDEMLRQEFALDVTITGQPGIPLTPATVEAVSAVDGISAALVLETVSIEPELSDGSYTGATGTLVADVDALRSVLRTDLPAWGPQTVLAGEWSVLAGETVTINGQQRDAVALAGVSSGTVLLTPSDWEQMDLAGTSSELWLRVADGADPRDVVSAIRAAVSETAPTGQAPMIEGSIIERASYAQIIDTLLMVVVGLLAVAVVIALIGVANTLSLSVVERRQENALLRALGLTRGQLRLALAWEGVLLASVGVVVGVVLGLVYGWIGSYLMLAAPSGSSIPLVVPWLPIGAVVGVAVVAGVLASVLPARSAVRVPPVVALGA